MTQAADAGAGASRNPAETQLVVKFAASAPAQDLDDRASALAAMLPGGRVVRVSPRGRAVLAVEPGTDVAAAAARVAAEPDVVYAEPDIADHAV